MVLSQEFRNISEAVSGNISFLGMVILGLVNSADIVSKIGVHDVPPIPAGMPPFINDVTTVGGTYPFPVSAQTTTLVSTSADDIEGGIGVRSVRVEGLDNDYKIVVQEVSTNGTNDVELPVDLLRVNDVRAEAVGSAEFNLGNVTVSHGVNVLSTMPPFSGRDSNSVYTIPNDFSSAFVLVCGIQATPLKKAKEGQVSFNLFVRMPGIAWRTLRPMVASVEGTSSPTPYAAIPAVLKPTTDIKWNSVSGMDEIGILAYYSLLLMK